MQSPGRAERQELADTLAAAGPGAPTLCAPWTTTELLAHLILRDAAAPSEVAARIPVPALQQWSERRLAGFAAGHAYPDAVERLRRGAPVWSPFAIPRVGDALNLLEFTVHHEDVRRALVDGTAVEPRVLSEGRREALWRAVRFAARLLLARAPVGARFVWPDAPGGAAAADIHRGAPQVVVTGDPVELALVAYGRQPFAAVEWDGPPDAVAALKATKVPL